MTMPHPRPHDPIDDLEAECRLLHEARRSLLAAREQCEADVRAAQEAAMERWSRELALREAESERRRRWDLTLEELKGRRLRILAKDARREAEAARWQIETSERLARYAAEDAVWRATWLRIDLRARDPGLKPMPRN